MVRNIDQRKITEYLLNPTHDTGKSKFKYFNKYGFLKEFPEALSESLKQHPETANLDKTDTTSIYGTKELYRCEIVSPDGRNPCILTVWQERQGEWHFVTAYPA